MGIHWPLQSSCCFLNTNTAITLQLIQIARMLEAEWWQVCGEAWVRGQSKMSQALGAFQLLDFTMLWSVLTWHTFWNLWTVYFFNFQNFFWAAVNHGYWIHGYSGPPVLMKQNSVKLTMGSAISHEKYKKNNKFSLWLYCWRCRI